AGRVTAEGTVTAYVGENAGVLVEVNCETDFVGRNDNFRQFADAVAKVIAGSKADSVASLNDEPWPGDGENQTVGQHVLTMIGAIKENISIRRFVRYETAPNAVLSSYIHAGGKIGVLVELLATSGAKNDRMNDVARDVAMHIAAAEPRFIHRDEVTQKDLDTEREIARDAAAKSGKPENIVE